jgi:hypothetical protein
MTGQAKKRLIIGLIFLGVLCFALFLYFNSTQAEVTSSGAHLSTETYDVGTSYSGQVTKAFVSVGDQVGPGDKMCLIKSAQLQSALEQPGASASQLGISLNSQGEIVIKASKPGTVQDVKTSQGSFVAADSVLATVAQAKNLQAVAHFNLSPDQYSKIDKKTRLVITLPSGKVVVAPVQNLKIVNQDSQVVAEVTGNLSQTDYNPLTAKDGAPVDARLRISQPLWRQYYRLIYKRIHG